MSEWIKVTEKIPPISKVYGGKNAPYVLAIDEKDRMSVGYAMQYGDGRLMWTFAKPISEPTHWMPLPAAPKRDY